MPKVCIFFSFAQIWSKICQIKPAKPAPVEEEWDIYDSPQEDEEDYVDEEGEAVEEEEDES